MLIKHRGHHYRRTSRGGYVDAYSGQPVLNALLLAEIASSWTGPSHHFEDTHPPAQGDPHLTPDEDKASSVDSSPSSPSYEPSSSYTESLSGFSELSSSSGSFSE